VVHSTASVSWSWPGLVRHRSVEWSSLTSAPMWSGSIGWTVVPGRRLRIETCSIVESGRSQSTPDRKTALNWYSVWWRDPMLSSKVFGLE